MGPQDRRNAVILLGIAAVVALIIPKPGGGSNNGSGPVKRDRSAYRDATSRDNRTPPIDISPTPSPYPFPEDSAGAPQSTTTQTKTARTQAQAQVQIPAQTQTPKVREAREAEKGSLNLLRSCLLGNDLGRRHFPYGSVTKRTPSPLIALGTVGTTRVFRARTCGNASYAAAFQG